RPSGASTSRTLWARTPRPDTSSDMAQPLPVSSPNPTPIPAARPAKSTYVLGLSCFYHDSAAALLRDGQIVAACQEERLSRKKHDSDFPMRAIKFVLREAGIGVTDL